MLHVDVAIYQGCEWVVMKKAVKFDSSKTGPTPNIDHNNA